MRTRSGGHPMGPGAGEELPGSGARAIDAREAILHDDAAQPGPVAAFIGLADLRDGFLRGKSRTRSIECGKDVDRVVARKKQRGGGPIAAALGTHATRPRGRRVGLRMQRGSR